MIKKKLILLIFSFSFLTYYINKSFFYSFLPINFSKIIDDDISININNLYKKQTPWVLPNLKGYAYFKTGEIDDSGGFGAIDFVIKNFGKNSLGPINFDNGGGQFDFNTKYLKEKYNITNIVYDPFMRTKQHNENTLKEVYKNNFDSSTSFSVLNTIDLKSARLDHINLCYIALKKNGLAFFKVWLADNSNITKKVCDQFQINKKSDYYIDEIINIFGKNNVILYNDNTIIAIKN